MVPIFQMRKLRPAGGRWLCLVFQLLVFVFTVILSSLVTLSSLGSGAGCQGLGISVGRPFSGAQTVTWRHCWQGPFLIKTLRSADSSLPDNLGILTRCVGCTSGVQLLDPDQGLTASQEYRGNWIIFLWNQPVDSIKYFGSRQCTGRDLKGKLA